MILFLFGFVGALTGILAGLFGISGGIVVIPFLISLLPHAGIGPDESMHVAIGTSLACMCVTSIGSVYAHHNQRGVLWDLARRLGIGIIVGATLGAYLARTLSSTSLTFAFGFFECGIGIWMFCQKRSQTYLEEHRIKGYTLPFSIGFLISTLSALLGVGGGLFMVPTLAYFHVPMRKAIATSAATGFLIALIGTLAFIFFGLWNGKQGISSYLYPQAFAFISLASLLTAPVGAKLAHNLPTVILRRIFGLFIALIGLYILANQLEAWNALASLFR